MIILWINWKKWLQVRTFTFLDWCARSCKLYFSTVPEHFINKREIPHCQWGWTVSHPHFYFTPADWTFLPSISPFSVTKRACSHAYTHAHRLHSLLLLASCNAEMPRSKMFFFFSPNSSSSHIWTCETLILAGFLLFLYGLPGTCGRPVYTQWHQTIVGNLILLV